MKTTTVSTQDCMAAALARRCFALMMIFALAVVIGCGEKPSEEADTATEAPDAATETNGETSPADVTESVEADTSSEASQLLREMIAVYRNAATYGDHGELMVLQFSPGDAQPRERARLPYTVAFERPNRVRVHVGDGMVVSDGEHVFAVTAYLQDQLMKQPAPEALAVRDLLPDPLLIEAMAAQGVTSPLGWAPIQVVLLMTPAPMKTLAPEGTTLSVLDPRSIAGRLCDRVAADIPDVGRVVYCIDQETKLLARCDLPVGHLGLTDQQRDNVVMFVSFDDATANTPLPAETFQFAGPAGLREVEKMMPPGFSLLAKKPEGLTFETLDGRSVSLDEFSGRVLVTLFWSMQTEAPSRELADVMLSLARRYSDSRDVAFLLVNVDSPEQASDDTIRAVLAEAGFDGPVCRDANGAQFVGKLEGYVTPTVCFFDGQGRLQATQIGSTPEIGLRLANVTEALLTGQDLATATMAGMQSRHDELDNVLTNAERTNIYRAVRAEPSANEPDAAPGPASAGAAGDSAFLTTLAVGAKASEAAKFGGAANDAVLLVPIGSEGIDALQVFETNDGIQVVAFSGNEETARTVLPPMSEGAAEPYPQWRLAAPNNEGVTIAAFEFGGRRIHLLDDKLNIVTQLERPPQTPVADVAVADFNEDGRLDIVIAEADAVESFTTDGKSNWRVDGLSFSQIPSLYPMLVGSVRQMLVTDAAENLVLDGDGNQQAEFYGGAVLASGIPKLQADQHFADRNGDGRTEIEFVDVIPPNNDPIMLCLDQQGRVQWRTPWPMPNDVALTVFSPVEGVGPVGTTWLAAGIASDQEPFAVFLGAQGELLAKIDGVPKYPQAFGPWDGRPTLYCASEDGWTLVRIEPAE